MCCSSDVDISSKTEGPTKQTARHHGGRGVPTWPLLSRTRADAGGWFSKSLRAMSILFLEATKWTTVWPVLSGAKDQPGRMAQMAMETER